jgi:hypothetical protein
MNTTTNDNNSNSNNNNNNNNNNTILNFSLTFSGDELSNDDRKKRPRTAFTAAQVFPTFHFFQNLTSPS